MKSFRINKYITLLLNDGKTEIHVNNELFLLCKKLILQLNKSDIDFSDDIGSVDEFVEKNSLLSNDLEVIPPELEFWGHCSNLQVWVEHNYDTRLLHSSLSFPLLKKLADVGDSRARAVLKEEILNKLEIGSDNIFKFLLENQYLHYFTQEEVSYIYEDNISKYKSPKLILSFLRLLSTQGVPAALSHYKTLVKELLLSQSYTEKKELLFHDSDVLSKKDLVYLLNKIKSMKATNEEKGIKFDVMDTILASLQFQYDYDLSLLDVAKMLLVDEEQGDFIHIIESSEFPYIELNFQADEVRRRYWNRQLYFNFSEGHVKSIEILYDLDNLEAFHDNLDRLKTFAQLKCLNFIFLGKSKYNFKGRLSTLNSLEKINIYHF